MDTTPRRRPPSLPAADLDATARAIQGRRTLAALSAYELSRRAGLSVTAVQQIEQGHVTPSYATLHALAWALGCRVGDLAPGPVSPPVALAEKKSSPAIDTEL